jgi:hypothetical protein
MNLELPTQKQAEEAAQFFAVNVCAPAFFEKLASHGFQPSNLTEARQLLTLGATLEQAEAEGLYKAGSADDSENEFLSHVSRRLNSALSDRTAPADLQKQAQELVQVDPLCKSAALIYAHLLDGGAVSEN